MYVVISFENVNQDNVEEWQQSDACEPGFQYMTDWDNASAAAKQEGERVGRMTVKKKEKVVSMLVTAVLMC
jgi:hypothetical protein